MQTALVKLDMQKLFLLAISAASILFCSQTPDASTLSVHLALGQFQSPDWVIRSNGFYELVKLGSTYDKSGKFPVSDSILAISYTSEASRSTLVTTLTKLLDKENSFVKSGNAPQTEEYSNYYGDVIEALSSLQDSRSLIALIDCINTGGMAINAVAGFGDEALSVAVARLNDSNDETKTNLFRVLSEMARNRNMSKFQREESTPLLENTLISGSKDISPEIRVIVTRGLARIGTAKAINALKRLSTDDRSQVREAAKLSLQSMPERPPLP